MPSSPATRKDAFETFITKWRAHPSRKELFKLNEVDTRLHCKNPFEIWSTCKKICISNSAWPWHRLRHKGFIKPCRQCLLDPASFVHISKGDLAIRLPPSEILIQCAYTSDRSVPLQSPNVAPDVFAESPSPSAQTAQFRACETRTKTLTFHKSQIISPSLFQVLLGSLQTHMWPQIFTTGTPWDTGCWDWICQTFCLHWPV